MRIGIDDGNGGQDISNQQFVTCTVEKPVVTSVTSKVGGVTSNVITPDGSVMTYTITVRGQYGDPIFPPAYVGIDIQTSVSPESIFLQTPTVPLNVVVSSSNYSATTTFQWDGTIYVHNGDKRNGTYILTATAIDGSGNANTSIGATFQKATTVSVVHTNAGKGLEYTMLGTSQLSYGAPFYYDYYLSDNAYATWKIFDQTGSEVRVIVSTVPRVDGDGSADSNPGKWDQNANEEMWDGRNDSGLIVPNGLYSFTFDAYNSLDGNGAAITAGGVIAYDVLRIVDVASTGITQTIPLANIKYTLAGASSDDGGATIKIVICTPGTTFYMASVSGSMNYLNGASTYTYVAGDPVPYVASNLKKVFVFQRTAGSQTETWNGFDDTGVSLPNNNYVFAISGTDDSGNHAIDNSGNDRVITGNVTIDRTASQTGTVTTPPTISGISAGGTSLALTGGVVLTQPFATLSVQMSDTGGPGISLTNSQVTLTGPTTNTIPVTVSNNGSNTVTLTFPQQSTNGVYTVKIVPVDTNGNTASATIYNFTVNISATGVSTAFAQSTFAYPNPVRGANFVTFAYTINAPATIKLEVYNILGEQLYQDSWSVTQSGAQTKTWALVNQSGSKLATGVYLYRLSSPSVSSTPKFQKLIIIQ